ncbi:MAG: AbrB/MazE/SpoVT family DNA-binding domain-containing protein [Pseudomonadota bacterium]
MHIVTTSNRGQIVIPKEVRKKLQIVPGKKLLVKAEAGHILITPLPDDPAEYFCGIFKDGPSLTKALLEERRKDRERESKKTAG